MNWADYLNADSDATVSGFWLDRGLLQLYFLFHMHLFYLLMM